MMDSFHQVAVEVFKMSEASTRLDEMPDPVNLFVNNDIRKIDPVSLFADDNIRELTDARLVQLVNEDRLHCTVRAGRR